MEKKTHSTRSAQSVALLVSYASVMTGVAFMATVKSISSKRPQPDTREAPHLWPREGRCVGGPRQSFHLKDCKIEGGGEGVRRKVE